MNVLVMYDRLTGTLWSQLLGEAVEGELKGMKLEFFPSLMTTWADWKQRYPETVALRKGFSGNRDPYSSYYNSPSAGVIGETVTDDRLYVKEFIVGVEHNGQAIAYPFGVLNDQPVVNHKIGDLNVLVVFNQDTGSAVVFDRKMGGQLLTFTQKEGLMIVDGETETTWNGLSGLAISGPLSGNTLERVKSTSSFWFGWKDFYPNTEVYGID
jgi:hypothetical protein